MKKTRSFKIVSILFIIAICMMFITLPAEAQCPMCRMSAETNLANGGTHGKGLNKGILYMFMMPYLLVFSLGYLWYRNKTNVQ